MSSASKEFFPQSQLVGWLNRLGRVSDRLNWPLMPLDEESLLAAAYQRTGLRDWGEDESFRVPLRILLDAYRKEAKLTLFGRYLIHQKLVKHLANRLLIQQELKRHPDILEVEIRQPLFIVSLPRTGSTLLMRLLAQDAAFRPLLFWEAMAPAPAQEPETRDDDPRIAATEKLLRWQQKILPSLAKIHHFGARQPEECFPLLENSLVFPSFYILANAPSYFQWLTEQQQDMTPTYRYYRQQLQILQYRFPARRWLLKAPLHMYGLPALLNVFPDAAIVQTHRDLRQVIPSACSLVANFRGTVSSEVDLHRIGQESVRNTGISLGRDATARAIHPAARFFDLPYRELVAAPMAAVQRLYDYFGFEFTDASAERMRQWLAANPKDKWGKHRYSLEQFGLTEELLAGRFADYNRQFGLS